MTTSVDLEGRPRCGGSGELIEVLTPLLDSGDPDFRTRGWVCPGCLDCCTPEALDPISEDVLNFACKTLLIGGPSGVLRRVVQNDSVPPEGTSYPGGYEPINTTIFEERQAVLDILKSACHHGHGSARLVRLGDVIELLSNSGAASAEAVEQHFLKS